MIECQEFAVLLGLVWWLSNVFKDPSTPIIFCCSVTSMLIFTFSCKPLEVQDRMPYINSCHSCVYSVLEQLCTKAQLSFCLLLSARIILFLSFTMYFFICLSVQKHSTFSPQLKSPWGYLESFYTRGCGRIPDSLSKIFHKCKK